MKLLYFRSILLIFVTTLSACSRNVDVRIAHSAQPRVTSPDVPKGTVATLTSANNAFAFDLFRSLLAPEKNLVVSPYSISLALAMTYAGARGQTESQMAQTLHFVLPQEQLHPAFNQLDLDLQKESQSFSKGQQPLQLDIANAIWGEQTFSFQPAYLDLIAQNYGAGIQLADFLNQPEAVRQVINDWVSNQTRNKIKDLIPQSVLDTTTKMVLVNAIYFKADWAEQFDSTETHEAPFHLLDGSQSQVKMMSKNLSGLLYFAGTGYQAFELVYAGNTAAMDVIVPDAGQFSQFESAFDAPALVNILSALQPANVALELPKFSFNANFDLGDHLAAMGMPDAFNPDLADFSFMTGQRDLFISKVLHQAFVAVDENGTEAAAATSVIMGPTSIRRSNITLTVDHPFLFVIRDLGSGQILFLGHVADPSK